MLCFKHPEALACGICISCYKGLCNNCACEVEGKLACKDNKQCAIVAERIAKALNKPVIRQVTQRSIIFFVLAGLILAAPYYANVSASNIIIALGVLMLFMGIWTFLQNRKL